MEVYDIDAALLDQHRRVRLRGETYLLADPTVAEKVRRIRDVMARKQQFDSLTPEQMESEEVLTEMGEVQADAAQALLQGLPRDVALDLTEHEFELLNYAYMDAMGVRLKVEPKKEEAAAGETEGTG